MRVRGTELVWWREGGGWHTAVTLFAASGWDLPGASTLTFVLYDGGLERARWTAPFGPEAVIVVDSARLAGAIRGACSDGEGVLAIHVDGADDASPDAPARDVRLRPLIDWYTDDGRIASLHSDQCVVSGPTAGAQEWTEIVVRETATERNTLVVVNGPEAQTAGSLTLSVVNESGQRREGTYRSDMAPFSAHRIVLGALVPDLVDFAGGGHLVVEGRFDSRGLYTRPYVLTEGERAGAYHGGDRYRWSALPAFAYKLLGEGEINPMAAVHRPDLTTIVNVLNSHGDLERDFWVDARLWDEAGRLVAERRRWLQARRGRLTRGAIGDLLPGARPFVGHVALAFSACEAPAYPRRLQALLEYRSAGAVSKVMAWSDDWNSGIRRGQMMRARPGAATDGREPSLRSFYRAWARRDLTTHLSVSNPGHPGYSARARYTVRLRSARGDELVAEGCLDAQASALRAVTDLFPSAQELLAPTGAGVLIVDSPRDLATVQFTRSSPSGSWAAEHLMIVPTRIGDEVFFPAGS